MTPRLAFAVDAAYQAGRSTLKYFNTGVEVLDKVDESPVTVADREAEELLRKLIRGAFPGEAILGEEFGETGESIDRWVIDPIDGTKSFICGVPLYGTLLSYEVDAEPILGVAYFPALDEMVYAEGGEGCFWNGRRCRVSEVDNLAKATIATGSHRAFIDHNRLNGLIQLANSTRATRTWSDAYGHCLVATGRVEAMLDPIVNAWDISAIKPIVQEAGGRFTNFAGEPRPAVEAVSTNRVLHEAILGAFKV